MKAWILALFVGSILAFCLVTNFIHVDHKLVPVYSTADMHRALDSVKRSKDVEIAKSHAWADSIARLPPREIRRAVTKYLAVHDTAWDTAKTDPDTLLKVMIVADSSCRLDNLFLRDSIFVLASQHTADSAAIVSNGYCPDQSTLKRNMIFFGSGVVVGIIARSALP